ncbi:ferrochelatase [bacterium]|nr:ferrochelatase [bacterium]
MTSKDTKRVAVLCLTYGEPAQLDWRSQYEYSLSILNRLTRRVAPIPKFITPLLAARRGLIRKKTFTEEGYHSPLEPISDAQAKALKEQLSAKRPGVEFDLRVVCEFRPPFIWTVLDELKKNPPDEIILVPMYVAESDFTSGVSRTDLENYRDSGKANNLPAPRYVLGFGFDKRAAKVWADFVWKKIQEANWSKEKLSESVLILGSHGTLQFPPEGINSSARETRYFYGQIRSHLKEHFRDVRIGWLNHALGGQWTYPEVAEAGQESHDRGIRNVVYFPFGFMADNAESQLEGRQQLGDCEWDDLLYLPCPNDDPEFMELLSTMVLERLDGPAGDWKTIGQGTPELIQKERPAMPGTNGPLNFGGPTLAIFAAIFWTLLAAFLVARGILLGLGSLEPGWFAAASAAAVLVGALKGGTVIRKMAMNNLKRLKRIPQPSPLYKVFSIPTWIVVLFFGSLGMVIRFTHFLPDALRSFILIAVGLALFVGAFYYFRNIKLAVPLPGPRLTSAPAK